MNLDALLAPVERRGVKPCKIARILTALEDPYKSALQNLIDTVYSDGGLSDAELSKRMKDAGLESSITSVRYHRGKLCSCSKGDK